MNVSDSYTVKWHSPLTDESKKAKIRVGIYTKQDEKIQDFAGIIFPKTKTASDKIKEFFLTIFNWKFIKVKDSDVLININSVARATGLSRNEVKAFAKLGEEKLSEAISTKMKETRFGLFGHDRLPPKTIRNREFLKQIEPIFEDLPKNESNTSNKTELQIGIYYEEPSGKFEVFFGQNTSHKLKNELATEKSINNEKQQDIEFSNPITVTEVTATIHKFTNESDCYISMKPTLMMTIYSVEGQLKNNGRFIGPITKISSSTKKEHEKQISDTYEKIYNIITSSDKNDL